MKFIKSVPLALSGLALSIAVLGNLLQPYGQWLRYLCGILSAGILIVFALKLIFDFPHSNEELKTPVVLSAAPTSTMALMLLCVYIKPYTDVFAICLWYAAVIMHLLLMALFFNYARENMLVGGAVVNPLNTGYETINGENTNSEDWNNASWWTTAANWQTAWDESIWEITDGELPVLLNVGGTQNP